MLIKKIINHAFFEKMKIKYYLNFIEENRQSMNMYGEQLINYQKKKLKILKWIHINPP